MHRHIFRVSEGISAVLMDIFACVLTFSKSILGLYFETSCDYHILISLHFIVDDSYMT